MLSKLFIGWSTKLYWYNSQSLLGLPKEKDLVLSDLLSTIEEYSFSLHCDLKRRLNSNVIHNTVNRLFFVIEKFSYH